MSSESNKSDKVFIVKQGCPLCGGDVVGNDKLGYYCKHCNLLFSLRELDLSYYKNHKSEDKTNHENNAPANSDEAEVEVNLNNVNEVNENLCQSFFVASKKSNKFHIPECPFAKNILPENRVVFKSKEEAIDAGFEPCRCVD